jgi:hypothetical protein
MTTEMIAGGIVAAVAFIATIVKICHDALKIKGLTSENKEDRDLLQKEISSQRELFVTSLSEIQQYTISALREMSDALNQHTQQLAKHDAKLDTLEKIIRKGI